MTNTLPRRFVLADRPTKRAAIGEALKRAFGSKETGSVKLFDQILERLNQIRR